MSCTLFGEEKSDKFLEYAPYAVSAALITAASVMTVISSVAPTVLPFLLLGSVSIGSACFPPLALALFALSIILLVGKYNTASNDVEVDVEITNENPMYVRPPEEKKSYQIDINGTEMEFTANPLFVSS